MLPFPARVWLVFGLVVLARLVRLCRFPSARPYTPTSRTFYCFVHSYCMFLILLSFRTSSNYQYTTQLLQLRSSLTTVNLSSTHQVLASMQRITRLASQLGISPLIYRSIGTGVVALVFNAVLVLVFCSTIFVRESSFRPCVSS